jgi:hypothetical protein
VAGGTGASQSIAHSYDGINWVSTSGGGWATSIYCLAWNGAYWLAGGTTGVAYSQTGTSWTKHTNASTFFNNTIVRNLAWNGTLWVALTQSGTGKYISYSYDGTNWTGSATGSTLFDNGGSSNPCALAWNGYMFVAGGNYVGTSGTTSLAYSYNGITWLASESGKVVFPSGTTVNSVAWNGLVWIAGASPISGRTCIAYSYDGIAWSGTTNGASILTGVCAGVASRNVLPLLDRIQFLNNTNPTPQNFVVAIGDSATNTNTGILYSYDGINWLTTSSGYGNASVFYTAASNANTCIAWNGSMWVAGGKGTNTLAYSYDGMNWTGLGNGYFTFCNTIAWNGFLWLAAGTTGVSTRTLLYSKDGINWTNTNTSSSYAFNCLAWNGSYWLGGAYIPGLLISYDGINWAVNEPGNTFVGNYIVNAIVSNGAVWVATTQGGADRYMIYSYDGKTWTGAISGCILFGNDTGTNIRCLGWNGQMFVAGGGYAGTAGTTCLAYSYDGINWLASLNGTSIFTSPCSLNTIAWNGKMWLAGGSSNNASIAYSEDGIVWRTSSLGYTLSPCYGIAARTVLPVTKATQREINAIGQNYGDYIFWNSSNWTVAAGSTIHMGISTGQISQGSYAVAIGNAAGYSNQGNNAIAIGAYAGNSNQYAGSIVLNASGSEFANTTYQSQAGFFVQPVRNDNTIASNNRVHWNATTKELTYGTESSDQRVKTNITNANTVYCLSTIESLPLRYFEWNDTFYQTTGRVDKHEVGFIAQEVTSYFPKSIFLTSNSYAEDFHSLDTDQIYKVNVGATKQLIAIVKEQQSTIAYLKAQTTELYALLYSTVVGSLTEGNA